MSTPKHRRLLILGSGPANIYTAAVYAAKETSLEATLITGIAQGGQLMTTTEVDKLVGRRRRCGGLTPDGAFREYAERFGTEIIFDAPPHCQARRTPGAPDRRLRRVHRRHADHRHRGLGTLPGPALRKKRSWARGSRPPVRPATEFFYRGQEVNVIGQGNTAVEEALYLSIIAKKVAVLHQRDKLRAKAILIDKLMDKTREGNIEVQWFPKVETRCSATRPT